MTKKRSRTFGAAFGPGVLFAGAAIGNSHLVQSTRAGAVFGLGLLSIVIFANVIKYPAFRFGSYYAAVTGRSLVEGYRSLGRLWLLVFILSEFVIEMIIIAASAITTSAVAVAMFDLTVDVRHLAVVFIIASALMLMTGGYKLLDRISKLFVSVLTLSTIVATALVIPLVDWDFTQLNPLTADFHTRSFIIALMGFMPAALSLSVLQSLWVVAKSRESGVLPDSRAVMLDMNIGYVGSAVLAVFFLIIGAGVMHVNALVPETNAGPFAKQILDLYSSLLGDWSGYVVGVSILAVIFTTLITIIDGFPRTQASAFTVLFNKTGRITNPIGHSLLFFFMMIILCGGGIVTLLFFMKGFREFIDFVTISSFFIAPVIATLNHIVIHRPEVAKEMRPGPLLRWWSRISIVLLTTVTTAYLYARYW